MPLNDFKAEYPELIERLLRIHRNGRAGHAYLFSGDDSASLVEFALAWLETFACKSPQEDGDACGSCPSCKQFKAGSYPGFTQLRPESKSRQIVVDQVRDFEHQLYLTSGKDVIKAGLIVDAECLNDQAQNALLKTLEEPPLGTILVLLTTNPRRLLPTIRSRCQTVSLTRNRRSYDLAMELGVFEALAVLTHDADTSLAFQCAGGIRTAFSKLQKRAEALVAEMDDEELSAFVEQDSSLAKRMDTIREAKTAAEYRRLRSEILEAVHAWFCQLALLSAGVSASDAPYPELLDAAGGVENLSIPKDSERADKDVGAADTLVRQLTGNMDEALAVDGFCLGVCGN